MTATIVQITLVLLIASPLALSIIFTGVDVSETSDISVFIVNAIRLNGVPHRYYTFTTPMTYYDMQNTTIYVRV